MCPLVLISSKEAHERLLNNGALAEKYVHVPLSIPSTYIENYMSQNKKDIDITIVGRPSEKLIGYAKQFVIENPNIKIAQKEVINGKFVARITPPNEDLVDIHKRDDYITLLQRSKVFLYSTPGYDDKKITNGLSQVTPRLLEALSCGCQPIMRYPDNADTRFYRLQNFWPSVETYEDFKTQIEMALDAPMSERKIKEYLQPHLTSNVATKYFTK